MRFRTAFFQGTQRPWPPRSPDLNPCDYYLWGRVKSLVYSEEINSLQQLKEKIQHVLQFELQQDEIARAVDDFPKRMNLLKSARGGLIGHLL